VHSVKLRLDVAGSSVVGAVILDARLQPTNPAHRLAASINEGIYSKVPEPDQV